MLILTNPQSVSEARNPDKKRKGVQLMKKYEAPMLNVDEFVPNTMIASGDPKNGNPDNNQNCWGCNQTAGSVDPNNTENACAIDPNTNPAAYSMFC